MATSPLQRKDPYQTLIVIVSIAIPVLVGVLFRVKIPGYDLSFLPPVYATINGITAVLLITAFVSIKRGQRRRHELLMKTCMVFSAVFLVLYVLYHMTSDPTPYGGQGPVKSIYYFILVTHILLSVGVVPLVLFTFSRGIRSDFARHRKLARITFPIWLYVAITGVVVYLMISPYYKN
jgi:putative membrane protein